MKKMIKIKKNILKILSLKQKLKIKIVKNLIKAMKLNNRHIHFINKIFIKVIFLLIQVIQV